MGISWDNQSTVKQDSYLDRLRKEVLGRHFRSQDLHDAYELAGISRPPKLLPHELTKTQATRMIDWLKHIKYQRKADAQVEEQEDEPCMYCAFGCEFCD